MGSRGRVFTDYDRQQFFAALKAMREACIDVQRKAPIGGLDHRSYDAAPAANVSSRWAASRKSAGLTMLYRSNTARVLWPVSCIATRSGTPARTRLRTAVRRRSCGIRPGIPPPAALSARPCRTHST